MFRTWSGPCGYVAMVLLLQECAVAQFSIVVWVVLTMTVFSSTARDTGIYPGTNCGTQTASQNPCLFLFALSHVKYSPLMLLSGFLRLAEKGDQVQAHKCFL